MAERSKDRLTDQESQQLSELIGRAETHKSAAQKAGFGSQLQEVLSLLNMMGAFKL
jgi:hypothetical protein